VIVTCAPSLARAIAVALPIPVLPPVSSTTLPCMFVVIGARRTSFVDRAPPS
jgi:hypothetical protein